MQLNCLHKLAELPKLDSWVPVLEGCACIFPNFVKVATYNILGLRESNILHILCSQLDNNRN